MYPSNVDIKIGMKVLVELKKDRGTGTLTEGIVKQKISTVEYDDNGIVVLLEKDQKEIEHQGRVREIIHTGSVHKNNYIKHISIRPKQHLTTRISVMNLFSEADDFIWLFLGYFRHSHFEILTEVLENNKNIHEIKISTLIPRKNEKNLVEKLVKYGKLFKIEFPDVSIDIKIINNIEVGRETHNRFYFTKNRAYDFIDFDFLKISKRSEIRLLPDEDLEKNIDRDFKQYWNDSTALSIFNNDELVKIYNYFEDEK
jgi:uncharacterized protein YwbE